VLQPFIEIFTVLITKANLLGGPLLKLFVTFKVLAGAITLVSGAFGILANILPVVGDVLFAVDIFSNGVIGQFTNLARVTDRASGAFILLLKNLDKIPFASKAIEQNFGPIGTLIAQFAPKVGGTAFTIAGLASQSDVLRGALDGLIQKFPQALGSVSSFAKGSQALGGILNPLSPVFRELSEQVNRYTDGVSASGGVLQFFDEKAKQVGQTIRVQAAQFAVSLGALGAFAFLFNEVILKSEVFKDIFSQVGEVFKAVGSTIVTLFNNPVGQAILLLTALAAVLKSGLIPALITTAKASATAFTGSFVSNLVNINNLIALASAQLSGFAKAAIIAGSAKFPVLEIFKAAENTTFLTRLFTQFEGLGRIADIVAVAVDNIGTGRGIQSLLGLLNNVGTALRDRVAAGFALVFGAGRINSIDQIVKGFRNLSISIEVLTRAQLRNLAAGLSGAARGLIQAAQSAIRFANAVRVATLAELSGNMSGAARSALIFAAGNKEAAASVLGLSKAIATVLPLLLATIAIATIIEVFSEYSRSTKEASISTDLFKASYSELIQEFDANGTKTLTTTVVVEQDENLSLTLVRKEIEKERGLITKIFDGLRFTAGLAIAQNGNLFDSSTDAKLRGRIKDAQSLLEETGKALNELQFNRLPAAVKVEEEIAAIQNEIALARANGDDKAVERGEKRIRLLQDGQQGEKDALDATIRTLEEQVKRIPDDAFSQLVKDRIFELKELRLQLDNLQDTKIEPPDLPDLGSAFGQLEGRAKQAIDFIQKGTGTVPQFEQQASKLLETTEAQLAANAISVEEVTARIALLSNNSRANADIQIKAQKLITQAVKQESDRRIALITAEQETVRNLISAGIKDEVSGEKELTDLKIQELNARRDAVFKVSSEESVTRQKSLQNDIAKLREERAKAETDQEVSDIDAKIAAARQRFERGDELAKTQRESELKKIDSQIASERVQGEVRTVDAIQKKSLEIFKRGQNERLLAETELRNSNRITESQFEARKLEISQSITSKEIQLAEKRLAELNKIFKGKEVPQVREQQLALQDLKLRLAEQDREVIQKQLGVVDEAQKAALDVVKRSQNERLIIEKQLLNSGEISERAFATRKLSLDKEVTDKEIQNAQIKLAELNKLFNGKEVPQVREQQLLLQSLTLQRLDQEREATQKQIETINRAIERRAIASQNAFKQEELALKRQLQNLSALERSLDNQNRLLTARQNLIQAQQGLFAAQANGLADLESSEFRRQQIQQGIAAKQLETTRENIVLQGQLLEAELRRNRIALEREQIENRIAVSQGRSSIAQAKAELEKRRNEPDAAPEEIRQLELSVEEQKNVLQEQLQLGNFLRQQNSTLAQEERLRRLQAQAEAGAELVNAQTSFSQSLRQGQKVALKESLADAIANAPEEAKILLESGFKSKLTLNGEPIGPGDNEVNVKISDPTFKDAEGILGELRGLREAELRKFNASGRSGSGLDESILAGDDGRLARARESLSPGQFRRLFSQARRSAQRQFGVDPFPDFSNLGRKDGRTTRSSLRTEEGGVISNLGSAEGGKTSANFTLSEGAVVVNAFGEPEEVQQAVADGLGRVFARAGELISQSKS
jgi:hypothetical protein